MYWSSFSSFSRLLLFLPPAAFSPFSALHEGHGFRQSARPVVNRLNVEERDALNDDVDDDEVFGVDVEKISPFSVVRSHVTRFVPLSFLEKEEKKL